MQNIEPGFYYHYKHNPEKGISHYAYEVLGVALHTEKEKNDTDAYIVIYRPLYQVEYLECYVSLYARPLGMFLGDVVKENGESVKRFQKITNIEIIETLKKFRA